MKYLQKREDELIATINHLEDQENWAKAHGLPDLARALSEGARFTLNQLEFVQKALKALKDDVMKYQVTTVTLKAMRWCIHSHRVLWVL